MSDERLPVGKVPVPLLARLLADAPRDDPAVVLGPGIGLDCAVLRLGERLLVLKSDPITFASAELGWYLVQVNANDLATTGAAPRWLLVTLLLPEGETTEESVSAIVADIYAACAELEISVIGGHTEITHGLSRPLALGTMIGEVDPGGLVTPRGASPGDRLLLTKGVPIEGTAILAREFAGRLRRSLSAEEIERAAHYLYDPGIGVLRDAQVALGAGKVTAMHDPTEGGLVAALWELAEASGQALVVDPGAVPVPDLAARICTHFGLDPLGTIASGALLLSVATEDAAAISSALATAGIDSAEIGRVLEGPPAVYYPEGKEARQWPRPERDQIARVYEND